MLSRLDPLDMPRLDVLDEEFGEDAAASLHARRRRIGARLLMLAIVALGLGAIGAIAFERGWAAAVRAAIGGYRVEKRATRGSAGGHRAATGPARRAEERRQGAHGGTTSGGAYHRDHEGGRGGLATRGATPVLVLEHGDVGLGHRKPTAMGRRRAAAPPPGDRALRIARSAQGQGRCASIADVSAVTTRADVCYYQVPRERWLSENPEVMRTWLLRYA